MYIKLFNLINNKKSCNITDLNKNLSIVPTLLIDNRCNCNSGNSNSKKYKYTIVKPDKDNDCIHDETYMKIFDNITSNYHKDNKDNKITRRAKKTIKEKISRKKAKVKKPKIKIM